MSTLANYLSLASSIFTWQLSPPEPHEACFLTRGLTALLLVPTLEKAGMGSVGLAWIICPLLDQSVGSRGLWRAARTSTEKLE